MLHPEFSLIIPCYYEEQRLPGSLQTVRAFLKEIERPAEVLVVVEKSADRTLDYARQAVGDWPACRVIDNGVQRGKGFAVRTGMRAAEGNIIFFMDADLSTPIETALTFLQYFAEHPQVDVLIGNRKHQQSHITKRQNPLRQKMGEIFNGLVQRLALPGLRDTQCGFKAFRRTAAKEIFARQTLDGFSFDVEVLVLARSLGFQIVDLPVEWRDSPRSRVSIVRDSARMLRDVLRIPKLVRRNLQQSGPRGH